MIYRERDEIGEREEREMRERGERDEREERDERGAWCPVPPGATLSRN